MRPVVSKFKDDIKLMQEIKSLSAKGVSKDHLYVLSHDDDRTKRIAEESGASKVGMDDVGFETYVSNFFRSKGDELRATMEELGFTKVEAENLEAQLDHGAVLLINTHPDIHMNANITF